MAASPLTSTSAHQKRMDPSTGPKIVAAPPRSSSVHIQKVVGRPMESGCTDAPSDHIAPAKAPTAPPMTSACILYE